MSTLAQLLAIGEADPSWMALAVCPQTDPEAFFPEKGGSTRQAKAICAGCDVRPECLEYALDNDERFGIWGGYSERERRKIAKDPDMRALILATLRSLPTEPELDSTTQPQRQQETTMPRLIEKTAQQDISAHAAELAKLLDATETHDDPLVRAIRKIVVQAGLALQAAAGGWRLESLPTSAPDETPTDSHDDTPAPPDVDVAAKSSATPSGAEPPGFEKFEKPIHGSRPGERAVDDPGAIREWAANHDIDCNRVGPIPRRVRMLYDAAHQDGAA